MRTYIYVQEQKKKTNMAVVAWARKLKHLNGSAQFFISLSLPLHVIIFYMNRYSESYSMYLFFFEKILFYGEKLIK